jgi:tetratricopeptide (TPR) repeat protein/tRNA A-37 threonylcarbamoyl transferase component Bud32
MSDTPDHTVNLGQKKSTPMPNDKVDSDAVTFHAPPTPSQITKVDRFVLEIPLGEGAFGRVWRAYDPILQRIIALKIAKSERLDSPDAIERFRREARNASQLQHPNIVTVFESGNANGEWFIASAFISGASLDRVLHRLPKGQLLPLRQTVAIIRKLADALGYAHRSGVIHRDIKPANVMLRGEGDAGGEPMIMDFGLAARADESRMTQEGQILGTPAYMAPEQWQAHPCAASDQYSLGVMLYEMLTGSRPFSDDEFGRLVFAHLYLTPTAPRLRRKDIPADLEAICLKCLEKEPDQRYPDCFALAEDLRRWLDGEPVHARQPSTLERVQRWANRNRALARMALLVAMTVILGTTISLWQAIRATAEASRANIAEQAKDDQLKQTEKQYSRAQKRFAQALAAYKEMVHQMQDGLQTLPNTQKVRSDLLSKARDGLRELLKDADESGEPDSALVWAHLRLGEIEQYLGDTKATRKEFQAAQEVAAKVVEADPENVNAQRDLGFASSQLGVICTKMGQTKEALEWHSKALEIRKRLVAADSNSEQAQRDLSFSYSRLGDLNESLGQAKEALSWYQEALKIHQRLANDNPESTDALFDLSVSYSNLGNVCATLDRHQEAFDWHKKALAIHEDLASDNPDDPMSQRDLAVSCSKVGSASLALGKIDDALSWHKRALTIFERLAKTDPNNANSQRDLSFAFGNLGDVSEKLGRSKEAMSWYQKSLTIDKRLAGADVDNAQTQRDLSISYDKLGKMNRLLGLTKEALRFYQQSLNIRKRLADANPESQLALQDLQEVYCSLARVHMDRQEWAEALESFQKAETLTQKFRDAEILAQDLRRIRREIAICRNAPTAIADENFVYKQSAEQIPELATLRIIASLERKQLAAALTSITRFAQWAETQEKDRNDLRYDIACLFARSVAIAEMDKDSLVQKSVDLLQKAKVDGYFTQERTAHLMRDVAFDGVRKHVLFAAFLKELAGRPDPE